MELSAFIRLPNFNFVQFADDKLIKYSNIKVVFHSMENNVGKRENAGYQHFLIFPRCLQKGFFIRGVKSRDCVVKG